MIRRPPVTTRPDTHCPYAALFRSGVRPHIARRIAVETGTPIENVAGQAEQYVERRRGPGVEIIEADEAVQHVAFVQQMEFLAQLPVAIDGRYIGVSRGQRVEIDRGQPGVLATRGGVAASRVVGRRGTQTGT